MKLLVLQETNWITRYPAQQHHLAEMMALRGHQVRAIDHPISWRTDGQKGMYSHKTVLNDVSKIHKEAAITVIRPGFIKAPALDYISMTISHRKEIQQQLKEFQPDVIIGFGILNSCTAVRLLKHTKIPFVYYWIDVLHLLIPNRSARRLGKFLEGYALRRSNMVLAINESLIDLMVKLGAPKQNTFLLRAGIDTDIFKLDNDGKNTREKYGISSDNRVLFFMGFLYHFSGLKEVARKLVERGGERYKLLVVGEGDAYDELKAIRDTDEHGSIILTGKQPYEEIPNLIAAADICLLPAYPDEPIMQDIVPIKLYEYLAMNKPVIATKLPGVHKEFGEGNGIFYITGPDEAVDKATDLFANGAIKDLEDKPRKFAERNNWSNITDQFENLIEEAIEQKR